MSESGPVIPEPRAQRLDRFRRGSLPLVVWLALAAVTGALLVDHVGFTRYTGLAHSLEYQVSPVATGQVSAVVVALNERVRAGQVVALMDDAYVGAMIDTANANLRKLQADLTAASASFASDAGRVVADLLRLEMDEESRRLESLALRAALAGDSIEIERRRLEMERAGALSRAGLAAQSSYDDARLGHDELETRVAQTGALLAQTESGWQAAKARREAYQRTLPLGRGQQVLLAPLREAIAVEEARLHEIEVQRAALVLRSPVAGQVSQVWASAGQAVRPGDPLVTVVESVVRDIVVYVGEADARRFEARAPVLITTTTSPRAAAESVVVSVGDSVQAFPQRLWRDPQVPSYGRTVVVAPVPALGLSAGELVDVRPLRR